MTSLKGKMAVICSVPKRTISYDQGLETYICNCGCGMEISAYCITEMRQPDRRLFKRLHRILRNEKRNNLPDMR